MHGRRILGRALAVGLAFAIIAAAGLPALLRHLETARARAEGRVVIYGTAEESKARPLVEAFERRHPGIDADYRRRDSADAFGRYVAEMEKGVSGADIVWSSSMSAQVKLINDGYSQPAAPTNKSALPHWASWKDEGFGVTAEGLVVAVRCDAFPEGIPRSHRALARLLRSDPARTRGRIGLVDPRRNEVAFMAYSQDTVVSSEATGLYRAIAASRPRMFASNRELVDALVQGRIDLAYNLLGSYGLDLRDPAIQVVLPDDYLLLTSRIAFVSRDARHPHAARLFLDYLLGIEAQRIIADAHLGAIRTDVGDRTYAGAQARPISVGPSLLADFDQMRRERLLQRWRPPADANRTDRDRFAVPSARHLASEIAP